MTHFASLDLAAFSLARDIFMQEPGAQDEAASGTVSVTTFGEFFASGGPIMYVIAAASVVVVAFAIERLLALRKARVSPPGLTEVVESMRDGRFDDAATRVQEGDVAETAGGRILAAGLRRRGLRVAEVESAMEDQAHKEADRLRAGIRPITLMANVAPLLGLLGTVVGIAEAFHRVVRAGLGKPENLAAGIETALTTTIAGLAVAIPAMLIAAWLQGKVRRLILHVDDTVAPAVELLAGEREEKPRAA